MIRTIRTKAPSNRGWGLLLLAGLCFATPAVAQFDNTNLLVEEAVNHIYQQRYTQAHRALQTAYEQSPRHPGVHFNLGRLFELTGNFGEALKEYQLAAHFDASLIAARRGIARVSVELKRRRGEDRYAPLAAAEADQQNRTRQPSRPGNRPPQGYRLPNAPVSPPTAPTVTAQPVPMTMAMANAEGLPAMPPSAQLPPSGQVVVPPIPVTAVQQARGGAKSGTEIRAETLLEQNKAQAALDLLSGAEGADSDNPRIHFLLGKANALKGDLFAAIKHFEEAIRVDEHFQEAYYLLAQNYAKVNLLDDAIKNYLVYFAVRPQAGVAIEIARTYELMGRADLARQYYGKANAMNPGNPNLQSRLTTVSGEMANDLYLRANHAFTMEDFPGALSLFQQAMAAEGLDPTYRRDAERKIEVARFRTERIQARDRPAKEGFATTRRLYGTVNLNYPQLANIEFKTRFTGPVQVEWRGFIARAFTRYGMDFLLMIKELSQDELDEMRRDRNTFKLNPNFTNQPIFLVSAPRGQFPNFARTGNLITFTGVTEWKFYDVINDLGQTVRLPAFELVSAHP